MEHHGLLVFLPGFSTSSTIADLLAAIAAHAETGPAEGQFAAAPGEKLDLLVVKNNGRETRTLPSGRLQRRTPALRLTILEAISAQHYGINEILSWDPNYPGAGPRGAFILRVGEHWLRRVLFLFLTLCIAVPHLQGFTAKLPGTQQRGSVAASVYRLFHTNNGDEALPHVRAANGLPPLELMPGADGATSVAASGIVTVAVRPIPTQVRWSVCPLLALANQLPADRESGSRISLGSIPQMLHRHHRPRAGQPRQLPVPSQKPIPSLTPDLQGETFLTHSESKAGLSPSLARLIWRSLIGASPASRFANF